MGSRTLHAARRPRCLPAQLQVLRRSAGHSSRPRWPDARSCESRDFTNARRRGVGSVVPDGALATLALSGRHFISGNTNLHLRSSKSRNSTQAGPNLVRFAQSTPACRASRSSSNRVSTRFGGGDGHTGRTAVGRHQLEQSFTCRSFPSSSLLLLRTQATVALMALTAPPSCRKGSNPSASNPGIMSDPALRTRVMTEW